MRSEAAVTEKVCVAIAKIRTAAMNLLFKLSPVVCNNSVAVFK